MGRAAGTPGDGRDRSGVAGGRAAAQVCVWSSPPTTRQSRGHRSFVRSACSAPDIYLFWFCQKNSQVSQVSFLLLLILNSYFTAFSFSERVSCSPG